MTRKIIIDAKDHIMGKLASVVAKQALEGARIVVVRTEELRKAGPLMRNIKNFKIYLRKRFIANPKKGHKHRRNPAGMFMKAVRGMLPYKVKRGSDALGRIEAYEGVPPRFHQTRFVVSPRALRVVNLASDTKTTRVGDIAAAVGWHNNLLIKKFERQRMKSKRQHARRAQRYKVLHKQAIQTSSAATKPLRDELAKYGYVMN